MKSSIKTIFLVGVVFALSAFSKVNQSNVVGIYSVSENDPSGIELTLKDDNTFAYHDYSNQDKKIDVTGIWEQKKNVIMLRNYTSDFSFHTKWKIENNGTVATSRNGMSFYRLVKVGACK